MPGAGRHLAELGAPPRDALVREIGLADQRMLFWVLTLALVTRLPIVPLHFWLPAAHAASPTGLSILLVTGFAQTAAVGLMRFALPLFPEAAFEARTILAGIVGTLLVAVGGGATPWASRMLNTKALIAFGMLCGSPARSTSRPRSLTL